VLGLSNDILILRWSLKPSRVSSFSLSFSLSRHQSLLLPYRSVHEIMRPLPNFAMCELRIVSRTAFSQGQRNYDPDLKWPRSSRSAPVGVRRWHTRRRISSRKVQRGVSNVITLDSCLLCSSTTKSYSALTSKAKLPSGPPPPVPSYSSDSLSLRRPMRAPFFPFFTL